MRNMLKNKIFNMYEHIKAPRIYSKVKDYFRDWKFFFRNVKYYYSFLREDRDWDFYFIYLAFQTKLKKQRDAFKRYEKHTNHTKDIEDMTICIDLLQKLMDENICSTAEFKQIEKDLGFKEAYSYEQKLKELYKRNLYGNLQENLERWWD